MGWNSFKALGMAIANNYAILIKISKVLNKENDIPSIDLFEQNYLQ